MSEHNAEIEITDISDESIHNFIMYAMQHFRDEEGYVDFEKFEIEFDMYIRCRDIMHFIMHKRNAGVKKLNDLINMNLKDDKNTD